MKIFILLVSLTASLLIAKNIMPENTVAVVNGMALFEEDLQQEVDILVPKSSYHASVKGKKLEDIREKAMKKLIDSTLLYQYALSIGIKEDKTIMEGVYKKLLNKTGSKEAVEFELKKLGLSIKKLTKTYAKDSIIRQLYEKKIRVSISQDELKSYYKNNKYKFKEPEKVRASLIYIKNDPTDPKGRSKAKLKAQEILEKIQKGAVFADMASKHSNAMSRIKGGDMGILHRGRLDSTIENEAYEMKKGEMSDLIEKDVGFYILKVTDKLEAKQLSFEQIKKGLKKDLIKKEEEITKTSLLKKLRAQAKIIR